MQFYVLLKSLILFCCFRMCILACLARPFVGVLYLSYSMESDMTLHLELINMYEGVHT